MNKYVLACVGVLAVCFSRRDLYECVYCVCVLRLRNRELCYTIIARRTFVTKRLEQIYVSFVVCITSTQYLFGGFQNTVIFVVNIMLPKNIDCG